MGGLLDVGFAAGLSIAWGRDGDLVEDGQGLRAGASFTLFLGGVGRNLLVGEASSQSLDDLGCDSCRRTDCWYFEGIFW